ncbi:MAG: hypothetical protein HC780_26110 [Leptolyngbyaceae cyanobacterium CSU_1_3]|nr:hypothetical protein [Leptolyngbyaceae cyanobacterium CSU_1_3]
MSALGLSALGLSALGLSALGLSALGFLKSIAPLQTDLTPSLAKAASKPKPKISPPVRF